MTKQKNKFMCFSIYHVKKQINSCVFLYISCQKTHNFMCFSIYHVKKHMNSHVFLYIMSKSIWIYVFFYISCQKTYKFIAFSIYIYIYHRKKTYKFIAFSIYHVKKPMPPALLDDSDHSAAKALRPQSAASASALSCWSPVPSGAEALGSGI